VNFLIDFSTCHSPKQDHNEDQKTPLMPLMVTPNAGEEIVENEEQEKQTYGK
jgi:hypothetical protein